MRLSGQSPCGTGAKTVQPGRTWAHGRGSHSRYSNHRRGFRISRCTKFFTHEVYCLSYSRWICHGGRSRRLRHQRGKAFRLSRQTPDRLCRALRTCIPRAGSRLSWPPVRSPFVARCRRRQCGRFGESHHRRGEARYPYSEL